MREILFRGKRLDDGKWVYGAYSQYNFSGEKDTGIIEIPCIIDYDDDCLWCEIVPESIGQYTGLTDKNGKKIFEGDIVEAHITQNALTHTEKYKGIYEVKYHDKNCYFYLAKQKNNILFDGNWSYFLREIEVIGNVYYNPKMMEDE
jgi:uncharacterized phage protein (TIGR01671 family)